jgi:hypothetical protein
VKGIGDVMTHSGFGRAELARLALGVCIIGGCDAHREKTPVVGGGSNASGAVSSGGGALSGGAGAGGSGAAADYDVSIGTGAACGDGVGAPVAKAGAAALPSSFRWCSTGPLIEPIPNPDHPILSVKDPTLVYFGDAWHLFATTADSGGAWSMVYLSFADWEQARSTKPYYLNDNSVLAGYHAAPQVFFFAPQKKWYLVFQSGQPQYSTTDDIANPESWTRPINFFASEPESVKAAKGAGTWLDFWVICDEAHCYLFFTDDDGEFFRSRTTIEDFPMGFDEPVIAIQGTKETLFEGSATYRVEETNNYLTLIEAFGPAGQRYYRSFVADSLDGEWAPLADSWENPFAGTNNVTFASGISWTRDISHGELIRSGFDQNLGISLDGLRFLYQGASRGAAEYYQLPYRLGLLTRVGVE